MLKWLMNSAAVFSPPDEGKPGGDPPAGKNGEGTPPQGDGQGDLGADGGAAGEGDGGEGSGDGPGEPGEGAEGGEGGDPLQVAPPPANKPQSDWKDKELGRKHRQLQEEKRERARLQQELDDAKALLARAPRKEGESGAPDQAPARTFTKDDVDRAAAAQVATQDYNKQCDDTFNKGKATYGEDWDKSLNQLSLLGGLGDGEQGVEVMQGILATDDPAQVLHTLGSNPDEYHRVMALPPARRLAEIVKLGIPPKKPPPKKPSALDPPPNGIQRRAQANDDATKIYDPAIKDDDWYAIRTAQKARNFAKTGNPFRSA